MKEIPIKSLSDLDLELISIATSSRNKSYSPYSNFKVGSAVLGFDNQIYSGCNIESSDYTLTTHAEMDAINAMVKNGCLLIKAIVVVLESENGYSVPCGLCRQKIVEFANNDNVRILGVNLKNPDIILEWSLGELIPYQFNKNNL